jgi:Hsp20/alpha crystallin family
LGTDYLPIFNNTRTKRDGIEWSANTVPSVLIPLPYEIDVDKIEALFKNGVLTIEMPKLFNNQKSGKTISVKSI